MQALRRENRRLEALLEQQRAKKDKEIERLKQELAALRHRDRRTNELQVETAIRDQCEETMRRMSTVSSGLESLQRINAHLKNERAVVDAMTTETQLRQLNHLKNKTSELEQLRRRLNLKHRQRQLQQQRQLREAQLQHLRQ